MTLLCVMLLFSGWVGWLAVLALFGSLLRGGPK